MTRPTGFAAYITVTAAYWAFMLTDGALRMLVLLHFHTLGFSPVQLAYLFVLYEIAGVVTNLSAGWIAARFGLTTTLYAGLSLQIVALLALAQLDPAWGITASVVFVMLVQGLSGVAKDLAKMSSKSAVKILAPTDGGGLFRWVAILTGSKNAVKGSGFRSQGRKILGGVFQEPQYQLAECCTAVSVRGAGRLVRGRHSGLFLCGVVRRQYRGQPYGLFHDRDVHGSMDDPLRHRPSLGTAHTKGDIADRSANSSTRKTMGWSVGYCACVSCGSGLAGRRAVHRVDHNYRFGSVGFWWHLCRELSTAFVFDPQLYGCKASDNGCRVLLHGQRCGPIGWHSLVWLHIPDGRASVVPWHCRCDDRHKLAGNRTASNKCVICRGGMK